MRMPIEIRTFYGALLLSCFMSLWMSCDNPDASDCLKTVGDEVERVTELPVFERVLVNRDVELFINQGPTHEARIITGENLINGVTAEVIDGQLIVTNYNTCNWVRDYGVTKVYITAPNLTEIRISSQFAVNSMGVLNFPELTLLSEDFNLPNALAIGDFHMNIQSQKLRVVSNNISSFHIEGLVDELEVEFYGGLGRFEGGALVSDHVTIFHRGSNDMIVHPRQSLKGEIRGPGDVIAVHKPPTVEVEQVYTGRLIFQE